MTENCYYSIAPKIAINRTQIADNSIQFGINNNGNLKYVNGKSCPVNGNLGPYNGNLGALKKQQVSVIIGKLLFYNKKNSEMLYTKLIRKKTVLAIRAGHQNYYDWKFPCF